MKIALLCCMASALVAAAESPPAAERLAERMAQRIVTLTADMDDFSRRVDRECRGFPEGDLFPYTFPLAVAVHRKLADAEQALLEDAVLDRLLAEALAAAARRSKAPGHDLMRLEDYRGHATYLGHAALALRSWRYLREDDRHLDLEQHLVDLLTQALAAEGGGQLMSFPELRWSFDTIPVLLVLRVGRGSTPIPQREHLVAKHLAWVAASTDRQSAAGGPPLPPSQATDDGSPLAPPRGSELSWRIALMASIDRDVAKDLWQRYRRHFEHRSPPFHGFREWPSGSGHGADVDSGPVIHDIGATATTFALAAARSQGDAQMLDILCAQVTAAELAHRSGMRIGGVDLRREIRRLARYDEESVAGFLFGDLTLAYAATWEDCAPLSNDP